MDFAQRTSTPHPAPAPASRPEAKKKNGRKWTTVIRWSLFILLISCALLVTGIIASIALSKPKNASSYINSKQYQAVFLNGGQVYFGKITSMNSHYLTLGDIYYLRVNQAVQPNSTTSSNDVSLVKLGCELHGPQDQMIINSDQVVFWENLKSDGQVAKAVADYQKQNPNGQTCSSSNTTTTTDKKQ